MKFTKPGTYQAKAGTFTEYVKILLWGSGYPFGIAGVAFAIIGFWMHWRNS